MEADQIASFIIQNYEVARSQSSIYGASMHRSKRQLKLSQEVRTKSLYNKSYKESVKEHEKTTATK